uniref:Uncharacterized protein n=1 Tax=Anguilla anguilla TaxID=7936 RepID=A0A0E9PDQ6_ANGAN
MMQVLPKKHLKMASKASIF